MPRPFVLMLLIGLALAPFAPLALADGDGGSAAEAKARLVEAFATDDDEVIVEAIDLAAGVADKDVIALVAKGLKTRNVAIIEASLKALGHTQDPDALKALHHGYKMAKKVKMEGFEDLFTLLLKEIGRHGDPSSIPVLLDSPFNHLTARVAQARVMALGNIRTPDAVAALIKLSRMTGGRGRSGVISSTRGLIRPEFRVAMATLTGKDEGTVPADWDTWWRNNERGLEISPTRPRVPDDVSRFWASYWGVPYYEAGDEPPPLTLRPPITRVVDPSEGLVEEAVTLLKAAIKSKDDDQIVAALDEYGGVLHPDVVHEVARAARSRSHVVKMMAVEVLGWTRYAKALKQLHRIFRQNKNVYKTDEAFFAEILKAIGRHGQPSSIKVLSKSPFKGLTLASGRARIYGLARIRDKKSVEELVMGTQMAGGSTPRSWRPMGEKRFRKEFVIALTILTGQELGLRLETWRRWWRENKKTWKISPDWPQIPADMQRVWEEYWNEPYGPPMDAPGVVLEGAGFLRRYDRLAPAPNVEGAQMWMKPGLDLREYDAISIDKIQIVPGKDSKLGALPKALEKRAREAFEQILVDTLSPYYDIVKRPKARVIRVQLAVTDLVAAEEGVSPGAAALEGRLVDGKTGETLVEFVDRRVGSTRGDIDDEQWRAAEGAFHEWAEALLEFLDAHQE